jgi:hypothetical protein
MKAALLFHGIGFPFPLVERAFSWAKQHKASLIGIFIKAKHESREGYIFPSDLDAAQDLDSNLDAEAANMNVIHSNINMLTHQAAREGVDLRTELLDDPSDDQLLEALAGCQQVFIDTKFEEPGILRLLGKDVINVLKKTDLPIEQVSV